MKEPPAKKIRAEAQGFKRDKPSRDQGSLLPGSGHPEAAAADAAPVVADEQTLGTEEAHVDAVAVRDEIRTADVDVLEQTLASDEEVADDRVDHHLSLRRFLVFREERLLFVPRLVRRVGDRDLADQLPTDLAPVLRERLLVVPSIVVAVEELALDLATNVEDRHREHGDEHVGVLGSRKGLLGVRDLGEKSELLPRGVDPEVLDRFLDAEEVPSHDLAGAHLRGRRLEAAVLDQPHDLDAELVVLGVDDLLGQRSGEADGFELVEELVALTSRHFVAHHGFHGIPPCVHVPESHGWTTVSE